MESAERAIAMEHVVRKQITVLFVDIVRSSDIVRQLDSESAQLLFSEVIQQQISIIEKYKGTVNQVVGDGIMCLFGVEAPFEEHVLRALAAGMEMVQRIAEVQRKYKKIKIDIRVGINTGDVTLNQLKDGRRYHAAFQATGETVHIADRILKKASRNHVVVSQAVRDCLDRYYKFKKAGQLEWGMPGQPITVYSPTLRKPARAMRANPVDTHLMPRAKVENKMHAFALPSIKGENAGILWLQGAAGIGKTHLLSRFILEHCGEVFGRFMQVNFYPSPISSSEASFSRAALDAVFGKKENALKGICASKFGSIPFLEDCVRDILHVEGISAAYLSLDVAARARVRSLAIARMLIAAAGKEGMLIVLEDMHWAQEGSLMYVESLFSVLKDHERILIICTSRQDPPFDRAVRESGIKVLALEPMAREESFSLLDVLDAQRHLKKPLKEKIFKLSGGNPYFIKQYFLWMKAALSARVPYSEIRESLEGHAPNGVADMLYNRLYQVDKPAARIAKIASVLGMRVNVDALHALAGEKRKDLLQYMTQLEERDILRKEADFPALEWVFTHELLQKVIYNSIPRIARTALHLDVIKAIRLSEIEDKHLVLAAHARKAGDPLLRYLYLKRAARQEAALSHHMSSAILSAESRKALSAIKRVKNRVRHEAVARLFEVGELFIIGKFFRARQHIDILLKKKDLLIKMGKYDRALSFWELYLWIKGDFMSAIGIAKDILSLKSVTDEQEVFIRENMRLANLYADVGQYRDTVQHCLRVLRRVPEAAIENKYGLLVQPKPAALCLLALAHAELGNEDQSRKYFDLVYAFADYGSDYFTRIYVLIYLANSLIVRGLYKESLVLLGAVDNLYTKAGAVLLKPYKLSAQGIALAKMGRKKEGIQFCRAALIEAKREKFISRSSQFEVWYAEALMLSGRYTSALICLDGVAKTAAQRKESGRLISAYTLIAECHLNLDIHQGPYRARPYIEKATELALRYGLRPAEKKALFLLDGSANFNQRVPVFS